MLGRLVMLAVIAVLLVGIAYLWVWSSGPLWVEECARSDPASCLAMGRF
jgi:hypothetical protein